MRKLIFVLTLSILAITFTTKAFAYGQVEKLTDGLKELTSAPLGFLKYPSEHVEASGSKVYGLITGIFFGADEMVRKAVSGTVNILTFPVGK